MPKKSNDIDLVTYTTFKPTSKGPAPQPQSVPKFEPLIYVDKQCEPIIPDGVDTSDPEALFDLFFDQSILDILVLSTNQNAELKRAEFEDLDIIQRPWHAVTPDIMRAYLDVVIFMGCQPMRRISDRLLEYSDSMFPIIREAMGFEQWNQIHRYFYVFPPLEKSKDPKAPKLRPFDKMGSLANHLRTCFQRFWNPGTHVAVDEAIQGFQGRASEIVTIPSKPTPTGFEIWVLAVNGYILDNDFLWHARGSNKRDGPQNLLLAQSEPLVCT